MRSTFGRLFLVSLLILLAAAVLISVAFQLLATRHFKEETFSSLENDANVIASLYQASYADKNISGQDFYMTLTVAISVSGADAIICDTDGTLMMCADSPMGCEHIGMRLDRDYLNSILRSDRRTDTGTISGLYSEERYIASAVVRDSKAGKPQAIVLVSSPVDDTLTAIRNLTKTFINVAATVVIGAVVLMTFFVRRQSTPLRDMAKVARSFGHGDLKARVVTNGRNTLEVEELALAFNNMASSLEKSEYQRKEFVANVSHELKTPMTTISGYVDGILDGTIPPEKEQQYLELVSNETKRLNRLVRSMLDISRLQDQGGIPEEQKTRFDICELAGQVLISFEQKILDKHIDVEAEFPEHPLYTRASQDAINQVIYNLVDNAVKFCPDSGTLGVAIREGGNKIYLSVSNDGEEIPAEELPIIFERFHKLDKSRSVNRDSWGLGLYIVKTIVDSHGENISVSSKNGKIAFTFTLPSVM